MYAWLCRATGDNSYWCQAMAPEHFAEWLQAAIGFVALIGIAVGWVLTRRTLEEMRRQTRTLRRQLILTDRAWLKASATVVDRIQRRPNVDEDIVSVTIRVEVENVGRSIAADVDASVSVFPIPTRGSILHEQTANLREIVAIGRESHSGEREVSFSRTVFPGERTSIEWTVRIPIRDVEAQQYTPQGEDRRPAVSFYAVGCVVYRLPNGLKVRVSSFGYDIKRIQPDRQGGWTETVQFPIEDLGRASGATLSPIPGMFKAD